jgi:hypothetical protein
VHDERHGDQRQQFIKEIHGKQIGGESNAKCYAVGQRIKEEKHIFVLLFCHVFKGVEGGKGPECGDKSREHHAHAVHTETDIQIARKMCQKEGAVRVMQEQIPYKDAV